MSSGSVSPKRSSDRSKDRSSEDEKVVEGVIIDAQKKGWLGDPWLVTWDSPTDTQDANPRNFSKPRKWLLSMLGMSFCGAVSMVVSGYSISIGSMQRDLGCSRELALLGVTAFTFTFGSAPLILAPLSEVFGRHPLYLVSAVVFTLFILAQAVAQNIATVIVARFFSGIGGSTGVAIVGGALNDLWEDAERSLPMNVFAWSAFVTTGLGPVIFGFVEDRAGWRYSQWAMFGLGGLLFIFVVLVSQETRASVLLARKAKKLRTETGDTRWYAAADLEKKTVGTLVRVALLRPLRMLFTEPVVAAFSTWLAFCWAVLYIALISIPLIMSTTYGFNIWQVGLAFNSQVIGSIIALIITVFADRLYRRDVLRRGPEARLYPALLAGILFPIGMWWYAWTDYPSVPWAVVLIGVGIIYCSLQLCYVSCFNYLADSYQMYAASALSAQTFLRNMMGAAAPLYTTQLFNNLGYHAAGSLLAAIATVLSVTPFFLFYYGKSLRERSPFASALAAERQAMLSASQSRNDLEASHTNESSTPSDEHIECTP